jgi:DDE superfamily endonuclease
VKSVRRKARSFEQPCRVDVQFEFGKHSACITEIFYHTLELFHSKFGERILTWPHTIIEKRASYYSKCVYKKGSALPNVVDFIDGTAIEIARPGGLRQITSYSGHKRRNCVNFQAVSAPDGLILPLYGPIEGRRHDMTLYRESKIDSIIQYSMNVLGVEYCLYGTLRIVFGLTFKLVSRGPISQDTRSNTIHPCTKFELQLSGLFEIPNVFHAY